MAGSGVLSARSLSGGDVHLNEELPQSLNPHLFLYAARSSTLPAHWPAAAAAAAATPSVLMECQPVEYVSADQLSPGIDGAHWMAPQGELDLLRVKAAARIFSSVSDESDEVKGPSDRSREAASQLRAMADWSVANSGRSSAASIRPLAATVRSPAERVVSSKLYSKQSSITEEVASSIPSEATSAELPLPVTETEKSAVIRRRATIVGDSLRLSDRVTPLPVTDDERRQVHISRPMIICRQPKPTLSPKGSSAWANASELLPTSPSTLKAAVTQPSRLSSASAGPMASPVAAAAANVARVATRPNNIPAETATNVTVARRWSAVPASPVSAVAGRAEMTFEPSMSFSLAAAPVAHASAIGRSQPNSSLSATSSGAPSFGQWSASPACASLPVTDCEKSDVLRIRPTIVAFSQVDSCLHTTQPHEISEMALQLQDQPRPQPLPTPTAAVTFEELNPQLLRRPHGRALFQIVHSPVSPPPELPTCKAMKEFVISRRLLAVSDT